MIEAFPKRPNTAEHVEMLKNTVDDKGDRVLFTFQFASRVTEAQIQAYFDDPASALLNIITGKLYEKGWADSEGNWTEKVLETPAYPSKDGKRWVFRYQVIKSPPTQL